MYIVCNVPNCLLYDKWCEHVMCRFWESVRSVHTVWCAICLLHEEINISFNGCQLNSYRRLLKNVYHESVFIIKEHILITWILYTVQKCKRALIHASTVPSLTIAIARFLARASLKSSTLVNSMSSSWNDKYSRIRGVVDFMSLIWQL